MRNLSLQSLLITQLLICELLGKDGNCNLDLVYKLWYITGIVATLKHGAYVEFILIYMPNFVIIYWTWKCLN